MNNDSDIDNGMHFIICVAICAVVVIVIVAIVLQYTQ
jgi:hypothetical protein